MKYEYTVSNDFGRDSCYFSGKTPTWNFCVKADGYMLYMYINNVGEFRSSLPEDYIYDYNTMRHNFTDENRISFTGKWDIITNDSDKLDTKLYVEVKKEYIVTISESYEEEVEVTGWSRLFNKYKNVVKWKEKEKLITESKIWLSTDAFEFNSKFKNECADYNK